MKKLITLLTVGFALLLANTIAAAPASASTTCATFHKTWTLRDGNVPVDLGKIHFDVRVCSNGARFTSTFANTSSNTTPAGTVAQFQIHTGAPYETSYFSGNTASNKKRISGYVGWSSRDIEKECATKYLPFCSLTTTFYPHIHINMLKKGIYGPFPAGTTKRVHGRVFQMSYSYTCPGHGCEAKLR